MQKVTWIAAGLLVASVTAISDAAVIGSDYRDGVLALNPVGYWEMDDSDNSGAVDSSGHANHGVLSGTASTIGQPSAYPALGTSYLYPVAWGTYEVDPTGHGISTGGAFSFILWFKDGSDGHALVSKGNSLGGGQSVDWELAAVSDNSNSIIRFRARNTDSGGAGNIWRLNAARPTDSDWHFLAATWDGTTDANGVKLYLDGVQVAAMAATATDLITGNTLNLGGSATQFGWDGGLDELAMFDYALSASQIASLYETAAIPEPASAVLMGLGAALMFRRGRRG